MKKVSIITIFFLFCSVFIFNSCKKENELSVKDKLIGTWQYEFRKYEQYGNGELLNSGIDTIQGVTIEFRRNDTFVSNFTDQNGDIQTENGIWSLIEEDSKIVTGDIGSRGVLQIQELTDTKMILIQEETEIADNGVTYSYKDEVSFIKK